MLNRITKTASLFIALTAITSGGMANAESENTIGSCREKSLSSETNSHLLLSSNVDGGKCSDYYQKCDEYNCYECTVCEYGGPYCWEISNSEPNTLDTDTLIANQ